MTRLNSISWSDFGENGTATREHRCRGRPPRWPFTATFNVDYSPEARLSRAVRTGRLQAAGRCCSAAAPWVSSTTLRLNSRVVRNCSGYPPDANCIPDLAALSAREVLLRSPPGLWHLQRGTRVIYSIWWCGDVRKGNRDASWLSLMRGGALGDRRGIAPACRADFAMADRDAEHPLEMHKLVGCPGSTLLQTKA